MLSPKEKKILKLQIQKLTPQELAEKMYEHIVQKKMCWSVFSIYEQAGVDLSIEFEKKLFLIIAKKHF